MKKYGWAILFFFMAVLVWNTNVALPTSAEAIGVDLWALFLIGLTLLVGKKLLSVIFPKTISLPSPTPLQPLRLAETKEIQEAFQREMVALFNEAGHPQVHTPLYSVSVRSKVFLQDTMDFEETLRQVGFKSEQVQVFMALVCLLEQCERLEATPQTLAIYLLLFKPSKPTTVTNANAFDKIVRTLGVEPVQP